MTNFQKGDPIAAIKAIGADDPGRPFLEAPDGTVIDYGGLEQRTGRYASALRSLACRPGDRVTVQIEKSPDAVCLYLACLRLGAVFMPLNSGYTLAELDYFIGDAAPSLVVADPAAADALAPLAAGTGARIETIDAAGAGSLASLAARSDAWTAGDDIAYEPDRLASLVYTSGTTGRSKGAMLSRGNLASNALTLAELWRFTPGDVLLHALPIYHVHGLFVAINTVLAAGAAMIFLPAFDARQVLSLMPRASVLMGVPTFYTRLLDQPGLDRSTTGTMRLFISGSAPLLPQTHHDFRARTGHAILERYGMTETGMNASNPVEGERVPGSVGPALPGVRLRVTEPETGTVLGDAHAIGMIEVMGPNVFQGYWRNPEKTRTAFRADGYFITGDLGRIDERGYVHIIGRGKDLVISGGLNVYPKEVESELDALPGIVESAVFGVPHDDFGEAVVAVIVRAPMSATLEEAVIIAALGERLARFKLPKRVIAIDALPRNAMGKVQKSVLRADYAGLFQRPSDIDQRGITVS